MTDQDNDFYNRADEHINLSNDQCQAQKPGQVSASMLYATSRFNVWVSARGFDTADDMKASKDEVVAYFMKQYKVMLEENYDDYANQFSDYMNR